MSTITHIDKAEVREEIRRQIHLGNYTADSVIDALVRANGTEWITTAQQVFVDPSSEFRREVLSQLSRERAKADRETPSQRRVRKQRLRKEAIELGLATDDSTVDDVSDISSMSWLVARVDAGVKQFRREAVADFLTDLLVPQAVPGQGWKRRADLTREDCLLIASDYEKRGTTELGMAFAFTAFADAMQGQGVAKLSQLNPATFLEDTA